ncbi:hypothetical protein L596_015614 [Steinernema carpocapsae]|uniref:Protein kinase domain-containing protein n=1 Tax=Steinernema carpocapsae TaxID=34508 RepID=A0A4U5NGC9_STECR|nr:hypothetical protein L596_015614 [Steinernema carpocapsae]
MTTKRRLAVSVDESRLSKSSNRNGKKKSQPNASPRRASTGYQLKTEPQEHRTKHIVSKKSPSPREVNIEPGSPPNESIGPKVVSLPCNPPTKPNVPRTSLKLPGDDLKPPKKPNKSLLLEKRRDAEEENENSGAEAEGKLPNAKILKPSGEFLVINGKKYIVVGPIEGEYGWCDIREEGNPKALWSTFRYESYDAKLKRMKTESKILATAAAMARNHILRLLHRGANAQLGIMFIITDSFLMTLPELQIHKCGGVFPTEIALRLCLETFECVDDIHRVGYVHRDIKPSSFAFGREPNAKKIYLTNFGLARRYRRPKDLSFIEPRPKVPFMGSVRYASRNTHLRKERAMKDDLESWLFVCVEFLDAETLSWRKLQDRNKIFDEKTTFMSARGFADVMKRFPKIPAVFQNLQRRIDELGFSSELDNALAKDLLRNAIQSGNVKINDGFQWDWDAIEASIKRKKGILRPLESALEVTAKAISKVVPKGRKKSAETSDSEEN